MIPVLVHFSANMGHPAQNINGVEIHYAKNTVTGAVADFKFVDP
jgi:hypothetical protein